MSTPEDNAKTVRRYLELASKGDIDGIADLYTEDATVEDPVGGEIHIGRTAIRGFYDSMVSGADSFEPEVITLRALGHEAAFFWRLTVKFGEAGMRIEIISVMTFDDEAKIKSMKAYWTQDDVTQL